MVSLPAAYKHTFLFDLFLASNFSKKICFALTQWIGEEIFEWELFIFLASTVLFTMEKEIEKELCVWHNFVNKGEKGTLICAANDEDEEAQRKSIWRRRGKAFSFNEKFSIQQQLPLCCIWLVFDALRLASSIPVNKRQKALWHKHSKHTTIVNLWMNYILHW